MKEMYKKYQKSISPMHLLDNINYHKSSPKRMIEAVFWSKCCSETDKLFKKKISRNMIKLMYRNIPRLAQNLIRLISDTGVNYNIIYTIQKVPVTILRIVSRINLNTRGI